MKLLTALISRIRIAGKLQKGRCGNMWCFAILRDDAEKIDGYRACSDKCAYEMWDQSQI